MIAHAVDQWTITRANRIANGECDECGTRSASSRSCAFHLLLRRIRARARYGTPLLRRIRRGRPALFSDDELLARMTTGQRQTIRAEIRRRSES